MDFDKYYPAIAAHAAAEYPKEACGIITDEGYLPMLNVAEDPQEHFALPAAVLDKMPGALAIVHSHPDGPDAPSASDIAGQMNSALPWGLCVVSSDRTVSKPFYWGDTLEPPPLIGREFRHGPSGTDGKGDCYALIRDWYRLEKGITLPDFPRDDAWWETGGDLYEAHFAEAGFVEIPAQQARDGDVFMMKVQSDRINHAGLLVDGEQLILHHLSGRLSRREPMGRWYKFIAKWVRYAPCSDNSC